MGFVDKVALGQVFSKSFGLPPVSIIPPLLHIHSGIIWGQTVDLLAAVVPLRHSLTQLQQQCDKHMQHTGISTSNFTYQTTMSYLFHAVVLRVQWEIN
jgi:hypothetical protein